jgi:hypothetical protein
MKYLSIGNNAKTLKSDGSGKGYMTAIMYMKPNETICPMSTRAQCLTPCLNTAGRGAMSNVQSARERKTEAYLADPVAFVDQLALDIHKGIKKAQKAGVELVVRLNGTSDIPWENVKGSSGETLMELFPETQFYDYTKLPNRKVPSNYHLTVSYSGANEHYATKALSTKHNVAVVFSGPAFPTHWNNRPVINGDNDDLRFLDPQGVVVALVAKGKARKDTSGFVVHVDNDIIAAVG